MTMDKPANDVLGLIGQTPMVRINRLNPKPGPVRIYAKLEGNNPTGSIKDRIAYRMVRQALQDGKLTKGKTIIEPTSGNTGIGLAMIGVALGYPVEIVMSEAVSIERRQMIQAFGAKVTLTDARKGTDGAIMRARELVKKHPDRGRHFIALPQWQRAQTLTGKGFAGNDSDFVNQRLLKF